MNFSGFYGNQIAKNRLAALAAAGRFPHALILEGPAGCGKRTLAKIIAQTMLCSSTEEKPCGECENCKKAAANSHPDLFVVSGGTGPRSFHIESIRRIREDAFVVPNEGAVKVYILENAGTMTEQAQNALLKVLEEPPAYVRFIMTCESSSQLLGTILSRAPVIPLENLPQEMAAQALCEIMPEVTLEQAKMESALWDGNLGRMVESLQDGTLAKAEALASEIAKAALEETDLPLLACMMPLLKDKELARAVFSRLILLLRDALLSRSKTGGETHQEQQYLAGRLTRSQLLRLMQAAQEAAKAMDRYANQNLLVTVLCAKFRQVVAKDSSFRVKNS